MTIRQTILSLVKRHVGQHVVRPATIALLILMTAVSSAQEVRYVSDKLYVQLRSGPSQENRILKVMPTGTKLTLIETDDEKGYSFVKTAKGVEGWALTRFLLTQPTAAQRLEVIEKRESRLKAELEETKAQLAETSAELKSVRSNRSELDRNSSKIEKELEYLKSVSSNAVALDAKVKKLTMRNQELEIQIEALEAENTELSADGRTDFILIGGGLVIIGILAGFILPSLRSRRSGSGGWA